MDALILTLIFFLHRYFELNSYRYQYSFVSPYVRFLQSFQYLDRMPVYLKLAILVMPGLLFATIIYYSAPSGLFFLFSLVIAWYGCDCRDWRRHPLREMTVSSLQYHALPFLFSTLIWFLLLGPAGVLIYISVRDCCEFNDEDLGCFAAVKEPLDRLWHYLDWLPARIAGLFMALIADFSSVFPVWLQNISSVTQPSNQYWSAICDSALNSLRLTHSDAEDGAAIEKLDNMVVLMDRCLVALGAAALLLSFFVWL